MNKTNATPGRTATITVLLGVIVTTAVSAATGLWVLTAAPIGFLFGFFLERSDLCGSSAFSEVVVMRDGRKLFGIWVVIVVSMTVFALGDGIGLIRLNPKPLFWASALFGGAVFGVGIVLAGGCISGVLFKAGQGNLNSMAALVAVPIGIASVLYGPLHGLNLHLRSMVVESSNGGVPTLATLTGIPYWVLALVFALLTLVLAFIVVRRRAAGNASSRGGSLLAGILTQRWKPWQSGVAIGLLSIFAYMSSAASGRNYPLGTAEGVLGLAVLAADSTDNIVWRRPVELPASKVQVTKNTPTTAQRSPKVVVIWMVILVVMLVAGSHLSARLRGSYKLLSKPPEELLTAFFGGILTGAGAAIGSGCVVGHIMSGVAMMSLGSVLFFAAVVLANWVTTRLYLMGIQKS